jgi:hypothetical protein
MIQPNQQQDFPSPGAGASISQLNPEATDAKKTHPE